MVATKIILHEAHNFDCIEIDSRDVHEMYTKMIIFGPLNFIWF